VYNTVISIDKGRLIRINILTKAIVSNSEMIKNYKACREKAQNLWENIRT